MHASWLVVGNANITSTPSNTAEQLRQLSKGKRVLALDAAFHLLQQSEIKPDVILGDFDSIKTEPQPGIGAQQVLHRPDQNYTDLDKALYFLQQEAAEHITLCHVMGQRLDHSWHALALLGKYYNTRCPIILWRDLEYVRYVTQQQLCLRGPLGARVALWGFPQAQVSSVGLLYELQNKTLDMFTNTSICNSLQQTHAELQIDGAAILVCQHGVEMVLAEA